MKIFLTEPHEISTQAVEILTANGHEVLVSCTKLPDSTIDGLFIRTYTSVTKEYLSQFPQLSFIIRAGTGLDNIDLVECQRRNIKIFSSPAANATSVGEHTLSMMLMLLKNVTRHMGNVRDNLWRTRSLLGTELRGKTVGLIGCGAVGQKLARLLQPFETNLIGYDKYVDPQIMVGLSIRSVELDVLLSTSDIVCVLVPLTSETKGLIAKSELTLMKPSSYLVNVSRGEVVNEAALIDSLKNHHLAGAAIDVVVGEPIINPRLLSLDNLLITPHIAGFTHEADVAISTQAVDNFITFTKGQL